MTLVKILGLQCIITQQEELKWDGIGAGLQGPEFELSWAKFWSLRETKFSLSQPGVLL